MHRSVPDRDLKPRLIWLIPLALFVLALVPRLSSTWQGFITSEEPSWVYNSVRFLRALQTHHWTDTYQSAQPGITTMWVGTLGVLWQCWRDPVHTAAHLAWIASVAWMTPENAEAFQHLAPFLPAARSFAAILNALGVVGIYALACRLWGRQIALAGAALIAFDPFTIALSGLLHTDALAATTVTLSMLAWLMAVRPEARPLSRFLFALASGLCAGLGVLSRSYAIWVAIPTGIAAILFFVVGSPNYPRLKLTALLLLTWSAGAAAAVFAAFPGMWADPAGMAQRICGLADPYPVQPAASTLLRNLDIRGLGNWFYPTALFFRLMPATLIGLALSLAPLLLNWRSAEANHRRLTMLTLWTFVVGLFALIHFRAPKFDSDLLLAFPALNLLAATGWTYVTRPLFSSRPRLQVALAGILLAAQAAMILVGWPYYLDTYNPMAGGLKAALRTLPVGWGEGQEQIARELNKLPDAEKRAVACGSGVAVGDVEDGSSLATLGPLFRGQVVTLDQVSRFQADLILITSLDRQMNPAQVAEFISATTLRHVVRVGGQEMLWLYETRYQAESDHLAQYGAPNDAVLSDAWTPFARHTPDVYQLADADEARIVQSLNDWSASHTRLWYLAYPFASPITASIIRHQLEAFAAPLDKVDLGYATAALYILPDKPLFAEQKDDPFPAGLGAVSLQGAALIGPPVTADSSVRFYLRWKATAFPPDDYVTLLYLVDRANHLRAMGRGERMLVDGRNWPTSAWSPGDGVERLYELPLPPGLPPGSYQLRVGLVETTSEMPTALTGRADDTKTAAALAVDVRPAGQLADPNGLQLSQAESVIWRNQIKLLGKEYPAQARAGEKATVGLGWLGLGQFGETYGIRLSLRTKEGQNVVQQTFPLSGYPTVQWRRGEVIHELYDLSLPAESSGGLHTLLIEVLDSKGIPLSPPVELGQIEMAVK